MQGATPIWYANTLMPPIGACISSLGSGTEAQQAQ